MRIWILNQYAYTPDQTAGTRHFSIAKKLIEKGHDVLVIASSFYHKNREELQKYDSEAYMHENVYGVPYNYVRTPPYTGNRGGRVWNMLVFAFRVLRLTGLKNEPKPELIIGTTPSPFFSFSAYKIARK